VVDQLETLTHELCVYVK